MGAVSRRQANLSNEQLALLAAAGVAQAVGAVVSEAPPDFGPTSY